MGRPLRTALNVPASRPPQRAMKRAKGDPSVAETLGKGDADDVADGEVGVIDGGAEVAGDGATEVVEVGLADVAGVVYGGHLGAFFGGFGEVVKAVGFGQGADDGVGRFFVADEGIARGEHQQREREGVVDRPEDEKGLDDSPGEEAEHLENSKREKQNELTADGGVGTTLTVDPF